MSSETGARVISLGWGVKQSFRNYVEAAGGSIAISGGTERAADGSFVFSTTSGDLRVGPDGAPQGAAQFSGEVGFEAHGGMLRVRLADFGVEIGADGATLTAAEGGAGGPRIVIAKLDVSAASADGDGALVLPAKVTIHGSQALGDHYPPGTPLDPVRLVVG